MADRTFGKLFTIYSKKVGAGKGKIGSSRGNPISGLLSRIEDFPTDPIRHNIPGWSDYQFRIKQKERL
jgi:hypothetical protein